MEEDWEEGQEEDQVNVFVQTADMKKFISEVSPAQVRNARSAKPVWWEYGNER